MHLLPKDLSKWPGVDYISKHKLDTRVGFIHILPNTKIFNRIVMFWS